MCTTNKLLSIIIPTYNMEQYLRYCLDSLLIKENFEVLEVLVINDGSKDSSSIIAHEYANRYPTVFRVIDKENGNYGSCINRGLKEAKGKYIKVLDADDSFDTTHFEEFVSFLLSTDVDLVLSDFAIVNEVRIITEYHRYEFESEAELQIDDICTTPIFKDMQMHAVTYRRQLLVDMGYHQTEGVSYTDQQWIFIPMVRVESVRIFNKHVYLYLLGREGQTMSPKVKQKNILHIIPCVYGMLEAYNCFEKEMTMPIKEYLNTRLIPFTKEVYVTVLTNYSNESKTALVEFDNGIKKLNNTFYEFIGSKEVSSFLGFRYIDYWRRKYNNLSNIIINIFSTIYLWIVLMRKNLNDRN